MPSSTWEALAAEAGIAAAQLALGATSLGDTSPYESWTYDRAFFALSIGIERAAKLALQVDAYLQSRQFLTARELKSKGGRNGHDLVALCSAVEQVCQRRYPDQQDLQKPHDEIHDRILAVLSDFATRDRYHHLDHISGAAPRSDASAARWWTEIVEYLAPHHGSRQSTENARAGSAIDDVIGDKLVLRQRHVSGREIANLRERYAGQMDELVPWVRMYTLQIIRWLGRTLSDLGSGRDNEVPWFNDFFKLFDQCDRDLRRRRRWRIE